MSCAFEEDLTAYLDGELPSLRAKQVESHLAGCADCRATEALLRKTVVQLKSMPAFAPSPSMRRAVMHRLDEAPGWRERLAALLSPEILMPSAGLAAAALVAAAINAASQHPSVPGAMNGDQIALAQNLDVISDYDVLGLERPEDLEVIQHLKELEAEP
jgi:anti-sigma factor RsiW